MSRLAVSYRWSLSASTTAGNYFHPLNIVGELSSDYFYRIVYVFLVSAMHTT